jgi:peptidoglycan hydrolase-like protein with peptidoglycan-binding domain
MIKIISIALFTLSLAACSWFEPAPAPVPESAPAPPTAYEAPPSVMLAPQETAAAANSNAYVVSLQTALRAKGYYHGRIDGLCGPQTRGAVANYQSALNVPQHMDAACHVGDHTWSGLGMSPGDSGPHQRHLSIN